MSKLLTCVCQFWTEGPTHNNDIKKTPSFRCSVEGDIDADPTAPKSPIFRICETGASPNLLLAGDTLVTDEGIPIFEM